MITAAGLSNPEAQVQIAQITGLVTVVVALIGIFTTRKFTRPKTPKTDPDDHPSKSHSLLAAYGGEQNEFIRMVIEDSKELHAKMDKLDNVVNQMRKERTQFIGAVGRYITKLVAAWGSGGKMPYPDEADMALLEETLPADWRHRSR